MENVDKIANIRLNPDGDDLSCINIENMKKCSVTKDPFKGKNGGYYYINHKGSNNNYAKNCEAFGFNVILSGGGGGGGNGDNGNTGIIYKCSFTLVALLSLLIL